MFEYSKTMEKEKKRIYRESCGVAKCKKKMMRFQAFQELP